ncbi:hypothetical protein Tcan_01189, partial [Toxocara canis]
MVSFFCDPTTIILLICNPTGRKTRATSDSFMSPCLPLESMDRSDKQMYTYIHTYKHNALCISNLQKRTMDRFSHNNDHGNSTNCKKNRKSAPKFRFATYCGWPTKQVALYIILTSQQSRFAKCSPSTPLPPFYFFSSHQIIYLTQSHTSSS